MIHNLSAWAATVQEQIARSDAAYESVAQNRAITVHNTGDSIWMVVESSNGHKTAFRAAFAMGQHFEEVSIRKNQSGVKFSTSTALGQYTITVSCPQNTPVIRYTTLFKAVEPLLIPFAPRDILPLTENGHIGNTTGTIHVRQVGSRSGQLFFSQTHPQNGTTLYFQNLSALSEYCQDVQATAAETVGGQWPEIGFKLPTNPGVALQADKQYTLSDAFICWSADIPQNAFGLAELYLEQLAAIYTQLPLPPTQYRDWIEISKLGLKEIDQNKGSWTYSGGHPYLNAYLCDYKTPPEIMVQLAVLSAIVEYKDWTGLEIGLIAEIKAGVPAFYDPKLHTLSRWLPGLRQNLDGSEEQKAPMTMDSWYLHHPLISLSRLAVEGDKEAKDLLLQSVEYAIRVAHHFNYRWPVFYKMDTLEVLKAETSKGMGGEKDVAGSYAYIMVNLYRLTGEKRYLNEAIKAAKSLEQFGLDIFYQANNTAFSAVAMLRLYDQTKDRLYLRISYLCLAGIIKNVQLFEGKYGNGKNFPSFFGVYPLNDAPYKAAYEEMEVYAALNDYIKEAAQIDAPIIGSVKLLLAEFVRYCVNRLPFYYPPMLPAGILADEIKTGELDPKLWIPVEDLYDGWEKNGQVGQEVYGAGVGFGVVPRQYVKLRGDDFLLFTDYPITNLRHFSNKVTFRLLGDSRLKCKVMLLGDLVKTHSKVTGEFKKASRYEPSEPIRNNNRMEFEAYGNSLFRLLW